MQHFLKNWFWIYFFFKLTTFGPSFEFFRFLWGCFLVFWDYFEVGFKFKNIFGTYYCWLSILFWNCNSLFLFIIQPNLEPIFCFWCCHSWGLFYPFWVLQGLFFTVWGYFRVSIRLNYILEPTNVEYHFLFWKCSPIFFNFIELGGQTFLHLLILSGLILGLGSGSKTFLGPNY